MSYETVGGDIHNNTENKLSNKTTRCMVIKGMNAKVLATGMLQNHYSPNRGPERFTGDNDFVNQGLVLGTLLGKKLKTRDEERSLKTTRMETGRMDRRMIAELGFGNDRVFSQTHHYTVTPALVHISIDASGSMGGRKWKSALKTGIAIAKAASMTQSLDCIISLRGCFQSGGYSSEAPLMWEIYDSRKDKLQAVKNKFYSLDCNASTPEGLCFEAVLNDTIKNAQGKDMYFINISDGEPGYSDQTINYGGEYAVEHTKIQVDKMRKNQVNVLSYFVSEGGSDWGNGRAKKAFERMYGKESAFIDVTNLNELSKSLNKLFERKAI
jgi:nitric oxide reductase activation protein